MRSRTAASRTLACLTALLAACSAPVTAPSPPGVLAQGPNGCGPCCDRDPAAEAAATQGISPANPSNPYTGKDSYVNVIIDEGTVFYSLTPGQAPRFAVTEQTLREANGSREKYYALVQVTSDPGTDPQGVPRTLRDKVQAYRVLERLCAARGIAQANPQFGSGGGLQYYVSPSDGSKLSPGKVMAISNWGPANAGQ